MGVAGDIRNSICYTIYNESEGTIVYRSEVQFALDGKLRNIREDPIPFDSNPDSDAHYMNVEPGSDNDVSESWGASSLMISNLAITVMKNQTTMSVHGNAMRRLANNTFLTKRYLFCTVCDANSDREKKQQSQSLDIFEKL